MVDDKEANESSSNDSDMDSNDNYVRWLYMYINIQELFFNFLG